jgi:hypothetical protein
MPSALGQNNTALTGVNGKQLSESWNRRLGLVGWLHRLYHFACAPRLIRRAPRMFLSTNMENNVLLLRHEAHRRRFW